MAKKAGKTRTSRLQRRTKLRKTRKTHRRTKLQRGGENKTVMAVFKSQATSQEIREVRQFNSGHIHDVYQYLNQILYDIAAPRFALQQKYHRHSHFISQERIYVYNCETKEWVKDETNEPIYFHKLQIPSSDSNEIELSSEYSDTTLTFSADDSYYFYLSSKDPDEHTPVDAFCTKPVAAVAAPAAAAYPLLPHIPNHISKPGIYQRPFINYAISSHGRATSDFFSPRHPVSLGFFTKDGCILSCPNKLQSSACADKERFGIVEQISPGNPTRDYLLSKDKDTQWKSGAVDCDAKRVIFNLEPYSIDSEIRFSHIINQLRDYHIRKYGIETDARVYCLFCRGGGDVVRVECSF